MHPLRKSLCLFFLCIAPTIAAPIELYIGSTAGGGDGGIYLTTLDGESGRIRPPKKIADLEGAGFQALSPDGKSLLSTRSQSGKPEGMITLFAIGDDRSLTPTGEALIGNDGACHVSFDHSGTVAMFAKYGSGQVGSARVLVDGSLSELVSRFQHRGSGPNPDRQRGPHAHSIYPGPDNRYAYAADLGTDTVKIYAINTATGGLSEAGEAKTPPGSGPRHMKFGKDSKHLYVLNELDNSISVFKRLPEGKLERVQDISTLPEGSKLIGITCSEIRIHPNGRFVYAANRDTTNQGKDTLATLEVRDDGRLANLSVVPAEVSIPRNINLSPDGKWLITGGQRSNDLVVFSVDPENGALMKVGDKVSCPSPMCYVFLK